MVKRYTLQQLLEHAANKEDIDRQAQHMEETLPSAPSARNQVNKVHQKRHHKPKDKPKPRPAHDDKKNNTCQFCGLDHKGLGHSTQPLEKHVVPAQRRVISLACAKAKRK